jgi:hypothetical protein
MSLELVMAVHVCNPRTWEVEAGGFRVGSAWAIQQVQGQPEVQNEPVSTKNILAVWPVVEHLPSLHKALDSTSSTVKIRKRFVNLR